VFLNHFKIEEPESQRETLHSKGHPTHEDDPLTGRPCVGKLVQDIGPRVAFQRDVGSQVGEKKSATYEREER